MFSNQNFEAMIPCSVTVSFDAIRCGRFAFHWKDPYGFHPLYVPKERRGVSSDVSGGFEKGPLRLAMKQGLDSRRPHLVRLVPVDEEI